MKHYSSNITDSKWMLLQAILKDVRKRKHSLRDILMPSFIWLKQAANGVYCRAVFQNGNLFITILPNEEFRCHRTDT